MKHALNITREENFPEWYQEVVAKADLAEKRETGTFYLSTVTKEGLDELKTKIKQTA